MADWRDISISLHNDMINWPGDPLMHIRRVSEIESGGSYALSEIKMSSHTGTHIDAPRHFIKGGTGISQMPLDATVGRARVIEIHDSESVKPEELLPHRIRHGERILFKTKNSSRARQGGFIEDYVFLSAAAADFLVNCKIKAVGIDYLSVGPFKEGGYVHQTLLGAGIWIIEGLDLSQVKPGRYDFICLPLKLNDGDGAPARAIIRPI